MRDAFKREAEFTQFVGWSRCLNYRAPLEVLNSNQAGYNINEASFDCKSGDVFHAPRWQGHGVVNTSSSEDLVYLAITDFGIVKKFLNTEENAHRSKS